jgi:hypothetical protein
MFNPLLQCLTLTVTVQVANYMNGGHYNPHHDYVMREKDPDHVSFFISIGSVTIDELYMLKCFMPQNHILLVILTFYIIPSLPVLLIFRSLSLRVYPFFNLFPLSTNVAIFYSSFPKIY